MVRRSFVLVLVSAFYVAAFAADTPGLAPPKQASFHISNVLTVKIPKGAKNVRVWFAVPQEDGYSKFATSRWPVITPFAMIAISGETVWDTWNSRIPPRNRSH